jgi:hypothetical protein
MRGHGAGKAGIRKYAGILVESRPVRNRHAAHVEDDFAIYDPGEPIGGEMVRPQLRHDDEVRVRHAIAMNQVADTFEVSRQINKVVDVGLSE